MTTRPVTVIKVGGSLLEGVDDLRRVARALVDRRRGGELLFVVVSALRGVTDDLERSAFKALDARTRSHEILAELATRHLEAARSLDGPALVDVVAGEINAAAHLLRTIRAQGEVHEPRRAELLSLGERLGSQLLTAAILAAGGDARALCSEDLGVVAVGPSRHGACDLAASTPGFRRVYSELPRRIPVLTGFYGLTTDRRVVLFGRGGSDDTASVSAVALAAERLELWKDVPGCMSCDPKVVPGARLIPEVSFDEAATLDGFGCGIVHSDSLKPLRGRAMPLAIGTLNGAAFLGTRLLERRPSDGGRVMALAARPGCWEMLVDGRRRGGTSLSGRLQAAFAAAGIRWRARLATPQSLRLTVSEADAGRACDLLAGDADGDRSEVRRHPPVVAVVGDRVAEAPGLVECLRVCLAQSGVRGSLEPRSHGHAGLSVEVDAADLQLAVHRLHDGFFGTACRRQGVA